ncbi:hypothetical protein SKAU_G00237160 [Synaphobranchus kaupii]|uniref:Uncharacterized protein n=1 Tax=Synaphobranchus kaupii TaxID=118154 RepID=A0A9Q1ISZ3_SYNKA|nr:hypothetical protein SKAU_G00237160 [Synaphobranchus kaupii]
MQTHGRRRFHSVAGGERMKARAVFGKLFEAAGGRFRMLLPPLFRRDRGGARFPSSILRRQERTADTEKGINKETCL